MIKNISIVFLFASTILFGMFALYQKDEAERMRELAIKAEQEASKMQHKMMQERLKNEMQEEKVDSLQSELRNLKASLVSR